MSPRLVPKLIASCVMIGSLVGCGRGPSTATISGEVKVDGVLIEKGIIAFVPADGAGVPITAEIKGGRYEVRTTAGKKLVQVSVPVVTGKRKESSAENAPWIEMTSEKMPEKYHKKSELNVELKSGGNTKDWDLPVKKK